jgi:hypothetical protein
MNLSVRLAGMCGTSVFLLTAMPSFYKQIQPQDFAQMATGTISGTALLETMILSLGGAIAAGFIGYTIGDILSHPDPKRKKTVYLKRPEVKEFIPTYKPSELDVAEPPVIGPLPEVPPPTAPPPESG